MTLVMLRKNIQSVFVFFYACTTAVPVELVGVYTRRS